MSNIHERFIKKIFTLTLAGAISMGIIEGYQHVYHESRIPKLIASSGDDQHFYRLFASCGLYDMATLNRIFNVNEIQSIQLHDNRQTVIAHTNDFDVNVGIYPERYPMGRLAEGLGYFRYKGIFGNREITGGIFCPPNL